MKICAAGANNSVFGTVLRIGPSRFRAKKNIRGSYYAKDDFRFHNRRSSGHAHFSLFIPMLRRLKYGQVERAEGPHAHSAKEGTPTMGGIMFIIAIIIAVAAFSIYGIAFDFSVPAVLIMLAFGLVGFLDDFIKVKRKRNLGLRAYQKSSHSFFCPLRRRTMPIKAVLSAQHCMTRFSAASNSADGTFLYDVHDNCRCQQCKPDRRLGRSAFRRLADLQHCNGCAFSLFCKSFRRQLH